MIKVKILAVNYGDKSGTMTVEQFQTQFEDMRNRHNWAIFAEDTANPEAPQERINASDVKDGMSLTVVPQLVGG